MNLMKLTDVYKSWMVSGIFTNFQNYDVPWKDLNIENDLNIAYYGSHSGDKIISPFVEKFLSDDELGADAQEKIAKAIYSICGQNWQKLFATLNQEYELLDNTNAHVEETTTTEGNRDTTDSGTNTGTVTHDITGTDTTTHTGTDTHAISGSDTTTDTGTVSTEGTTGTDRTVNNDIYGFNSSDASNADKQTGTDNTTANQTETRNTSEKVDHDTTDTETLNTQDSLSRNTKDTETRDLADSRTGNEKTNETVTHSVHRFGNIGVTTSQEMLQEERDLWQWYFYEYVFKDLDRFLTIAVY